MRFRTVATLVAFSCAAPLAAFAQSSPIDPGVWQIGGSAGFSSETSQSGGGRTTTIAFNPDVMYFVSHGVAFGASLPLGYSRDPRYHSTTYGLGPEFRYYIGSGRGKIIPYIGASAVLSRTSYNVGAGPFGSYEYKLSSQTYEGVAGAAVSLARNVALTGEAYYHELHVSADPAAPPLALETNSFGVRFGLAVFIY